ncbi:MAG: OmpH family outer membrane protein [Pseudomonadota bacterium]
MAAGRRAVVLAALAALLALPVAAQQRTSPLSILLIDRDAVLSGSIPGRRLLEAEEAAKDALLEESQALSEALEAEERALSAQRAEMAPEDFAPLAAAFDEKVIAARRAQDEKAAQLARQIEANRRVFFEEVNRATAAVMQSYGASAVLDLRTVVVAAGGLNITGDVIGRLNRATIAADEAREAAEAEAAGEGEADATERSP